MIKYALIKLLKLFLYTGATPQMIHKAAALPGQKFFAFNIFQSYQGFVLPRLRALH